jgi:hypothetical protein
LADRSSRMALRDDEDFGLFQRYTIHLVHSVAATASGNGSCLKAHGRHVPAYSRRHQLGKVQNKRTHADMVMTRSIVVEVIKVPCRPIIQPRVSTSQKTNPRDAMPNIVPCQREIIMSPMHFKKGKAWAHNALLVGNQTSQLSSHFCVLKETVRGLQGVYRDPIQEPVREFRNQFEGICGVEFSSFRPPSIPLHGDTLLRSIIDPTFPFIHRAPARSQLVPSLTVN